MRPPILFLALVLSGCTSSEEGFTLYRSALIGETARFHVFTFDAAGVFPEMGRTKGLMAG
jgi:hypothetical protein